MSYSDLVSARKQIYSSLGFDAIMEIYNRSFDAPN